MDHSVNWQYGMLGSLSSQLAPGLPHQLVPQRKPAAWLLHGCGHTRVPWGRGAPLDLGYAEVAEADVLMVHQLHQGMPASECCSEPACHNDGTRQQEEED